MRIILVFVLFLFSGCRVNTKIPRNVLDQDQMYIIMWDMIRADKFVSEFMTKDTTLDKKTESYKLYEQVYELHSTTEEEFKRSLAFYQGRPDLLKTITDSLRSMERKILEEQYPTELPVVDSPLRKTFKKPPARD